jgi:acyl-coenzyme A thioesterase PaaI-like protein
MSDFDFDQAIALQSLGAGQYSGNTHAAWMNMVGTFGGMTAAVMLQAVMQHPDRLGNPVSLTVNFCAGVAEGAFEVTAKPSRTNRSTQHWLIELVQTNEIIITATAVTAVRRSTFSSLETPIPKVTPAINLLPALTPSLEWPKRYDMRSIVGGLPNVWDGKDGDTLTQVWVRDIQERMVDFVSLTALADTFFPRVFLRRAVFVPIGTVSMTVYFHADAEELAAIGTGFVLGQAKAQCLFNGFFDQTAQLWSEAGTLLATSHQVVYYKE